MSRFHPQRGRVPSGRSPTTPEDEGKDWDWGGQRSGSAQRFRPLGFMIVVPVCVLIRIPGFDCLRHDH
jgi:hypothetical protein